MFGFVREGKLPSCHCAIPTAGRVHFNCGRFYRRRLYRSAKCARGGTILMLCLSIKCKSAHIDHPHPCPFSKQQYFTASQYFLPSQATSPVFPPDASPAATRCAGARVANTSATTSLSDQVKIASLLFLTPFYTEVPRRPPRRNGNKLTTPDFVRSFLQAK